MKQFINQQDMKQINAADIFTLIRESGHITRRQLAAKSNMSWAAISNIICQLIDEGYVTEGASETGGLGRNPRSLEVNGEKYVAVGIDINASGLRAVLLNLKSEVVRTWTANADFSSRERLLADLFRFTDDVCREIPPERLVCIGVAMQGAVDAANGISIGLSQCPNWSYVPLAGILADRYRVPVHLAHDPNCILYALHGTLKGEDAMLVRVDNGIGMAVTLGGHILDKAGALELGHTVVKRGGVPCPCGRMGCLERYASQSGLAALAGMPFAELAALAHAGNEKARARFLEMADLLAFAVGSTAHLLNVRRVVLCGEMWEHKALFYDAFLRAAAEHDPENRLAFSFTDVGNAASGAALLAIRDALRQIGKKASGTTRSISNQL